MRYDRTDERDHSGRDALLTVPGMSEVLFQEKKPPKHESPLAWTVVVVVITLIFWIFWGYTELDYKREKARCTEKVQAVCTYADKSIDLSDDYTHHRIPHHRTMKYSLEFQGEKYILDLSFTADEPGYYTEEGDEVTVRIDPKEPMNYIVEGYDDASTPSVPIAPLAITVIGLIVLPLKWANRI